jgi:hypothetical protein
MSSIWQGQFLTECSNLENMLITMMMFSQNNKHFQEVHLEMLNETFGVRIREFKKAAASYTFSQEHRAAIDSVSVRLDKLLPKRNYIVHGVTMEIELGDAPSIVYRIGIPKGNLEYMNEFLAQGGKADNAFTAEHVRQSTIECSSIATQLGPVLNHLMNELVEESKARLAQYIWTSRCRLGALVMRGHGALSVVRLKLVRCAREPVGGYRFAPPILRAVGLGGLSGIVGSVG